MSNAFKFPFREPIVVLIGPTAVGKTALSIDIAREFGFEIISVDSMQVYRYMDIGTAKITREEMKGVKHHLIDVVDPDEPFDAGIYEARALDAIRDIYTKKKKILVTGGTGLYLSALMNGLAPKLPTFPGIRKELAVELNTMGHDVLHEQLSLVDRTSAKRIHKNDSHRLVRALEIFRGTGKKWSALIEEHKRHDTKRFPKTLIIGLTRDRARLYERIDQRSRIMLENGFEDEVRGLLNRGYREDCKSMQSIGYSHMTKFIKGDLSRNEMIEQLTRDTRRYAKRQYTWFNKIKEVQWLETSDSGIAKAMIRDFL